jgi:hypothetical protein
LTAEGTLVRYVAGYIASENAILVGTGDHQLLGRLDNAGAQLMLTDLDGDGRPELLSSMPTLVASEDMLLVHTVEPSGQLTQRLRIRVPDGITAIASCPISTRSMAPIVVGTRTHLWIIQ